MALDNFEDGLKNADLGLKIGSDKELRPKKNINSRDEDITSLVKTIKLDHENRIKNRRVYQQIISILLLTIVSLFFFGFVAIVILSAMDIIKKLNLIITLISSVATSFIASVVSLLLVVVKYIFPADQDENNLNTIATIHSSDIDALCRSEKTSQIGDVENQ